MESVELACRRALSQCCPSAHGGRNSLEVLGPEIVEFKKVAEKPSCALGDNHGVRLGDRLELRGNVWSFADDAAFVGACRIGDVADDNEAGGNSDARLRRRARLQCPHRRNQFKRRSNRTLGVVLVRLRITKINDGCVAVRVGDESFVPPDRLNDTIVIALDNLA